MSDDQQWALSPGWRRMVDESRADYAAGRSRTFDSVDAFLADLAAVRSHTAEPALRLDSIRAGSNRRGV